MGKLNLHKVGMAFGGLFAVLHAVWAILIASGAAYALLGWIFNLHMIDLQYTIHAFSLGYAIGLVAVTAVVGYVIGTVFAYIWNWALRM
jgi:hypothetical protein